jgi:hypothetical protein
MDPIVVNEKTCRGDKGYAKAHMIETGDHNCQRVLETEKMNILLAYNCEYVFLSFILVITTIFLRF